MEFTEQEMEYFVKNVWCAEFENNGGGMGAPDLFTFWFILNKYKPKIVVESGVWNGVGTRLIRKTLPDSKIICLDPRDVPEYGYRDTNKNTEYYIGNNFIDFKDLDLNYYNSNEIVCFFDCHQNAYLRVLQCIEKKVNKIFFNDNFPVNCGSHYTMEHLIKNDNRHFFVDFETKSWLIKLMDIYHIFPNIYPGRIQTMEGIFDCDSYFKNGNDDHRFEILKKEGFKYSWNTFIKLKI
jgi:hypothetical protein